jgi:hypothetical protein
MIAEATLSRKVLWGKIISSSCQIPISKSLPRPLVTSRFHYEGGPFAHGWSPPISMWPQTLQISVIPELLPMLTGTALWFYPDSIPVVQPGPPSAWVHSCEHARKALGADLALSLRWCCCRLEAYPAIGQKGRGGLVAPTCSCFPLSPETLCLWCAVPAGDQGSQVQDVNLSMLCGPH